MNKISVIIPAYNAAKTVEKTVRSVMASTIPLDVYVVDDGSTDETATIVERLNSQLSNARIGVRVRHAHYGLTLNLIRQANQGAYMARLNALKQITTPYFGFVDADDTVEPDMFEKMLAVAEREKCDVVQCSVDGIADSELGVWYQRLVGSAHRADRNPYVTEDSFETDSARNGVRALPLLPDRRVVEEQFIKPHLVKGEGSSFIWNKLYRNQYDFSQFVTFDRLTNYDDMIFNFQFFEKVERMAFMPDKLYHYAATAGSATHSYGARQFVDFKACAKFRRERGVPSKRWLAVNLKSAAASVVRAKMRLGEKAKWLARLAAGAAGKEQRIERIERIMRG